MEDSGSEVSVCRAFRGLGAAFRRVTHSRFQALFNILRVLQGLQRVLGLGAVLGFGDSLGSYSRAFRVVWIRVLSTRSKIEG